MFSSERKPLSTEDHMNTERCLENLGLNIFTFSFSNSHWKRRSPRGLKVADNIVWFFHALIWQEEIRNFKHLLLTLTQKDIKLQERPCLKFKKKKKSLACSRSKCYIKWVLTACKFTYEVPRAFTVFKFCCWFLCLFLIISILYFTTLVRFCLLESTTQQLHQQLQSKKQRH